MRCKHVRELCQQVQALVRDLGPLSALLLLQTFFRAGIFHREEAELVDGWALRPSVCPCIGVSFTCHFLSALLAVFLPRFPSLSPLSLLYQLSVPL
jgi:hypothetical protein